MVRHRYIYILSVVITLAILLLQYKKWQDVTFLEEHQISLSTTGVGDTIGISGILYDPEDLYDYFFKRNYNNRAPFSADISADSLDFTNYDYLFVEGRPITRLVKQFWDGCSRYDETELIPIEASFGTTKSKKVYIYKISPKNKYRYACP